MSVKKEMSNSIDLSAEEKKVLEKFVDDNQLFYGPDPQIVRNHELMPRTQEEARALEAGIDAQRINLVRGRLESALEEGFNMVEKMGVAPGAKWGDLVTAVFTSSGDMAQIAPSGIGVFASVCQYPIKFIINIGQKNLRSASRMVTDSFIMTLVTAESTIPIKA